MVDYSDFTATGFSIAETLIKGQSDPQLNYMWEVNIAGGNRSHDYHSNAQLYAIDCSIPQRSVETIQRNFMGEPVTHAANKSHENSIRCTFWDDRSLSGFRYFNQWFNMVSDPEYGRKAKNDRIKREVSLILKDRTDFFKGAKVDFTNVIVSEIGEISLSYDESAPMQFEITLIFENMLINETSYKINQQNPQQPQREDGVVNSVLDTVGGFF